MGNDMPKEFNNCYIHSKNSDVLLYKGSLGAGRNEELTIVSPWFHVLCSVCVLSTSSRGLLVMSVSVYILVGQSIISSRTVDLVRLIQRPNHETSAHRFKNDNIYFKSVSATNSVDI